MSEEQDNKIAISKALYELMKMSTSWVIRKIEAEEPFSAIMVSNHPDGRKATIYQFDSGEETFVRSEEDLRTYLADAEAYALAYDAWFVNGEEKTPVIMCRVEELGMESQHEFAIVYELNIKRKGKSVKPLTDFQYIGEKEARKLTSG